MAEQLALTPPRTEGPFYPDRLSLDTDSDLILLNDSTTPAVGEIAHLTGRIIDASGSPIRNATIEIWQCDANQFSLNTNDSDAKKKPQDARRPGHQAEKRDRAPSVTVASTSDEDDP